MEQQENVLTRFLSHQDVLGMIFCHLSPVPGADPAVHNLRDTRRLLWACSLACKGFLHPALDAQWSYMSSISPLCQLLPYEEKNGLHVLRKPVEPVQWTIFESYARRIRSFGGFGSSGVRWQQVIADICSMSRSTVLPAVRSLYFPFFMERNPQLPPLATLPLIDLGQLHSIVLVNVNTALYGELAKPLIEELSLAHSSSGQLRFLKLGGYFPHQSLSLLEGFRKLEHFELTLQAVTLNYDFLHILGRLPSLKYLDLDFKACEWQATDVIVKDHVAQTPPFLKRPLPLQFLRIAGALPIILNMLEGLALAQSALQSLEVFCRITQPGLDIPNCVHGILPLKSLHSLTIANTERWSRYNLDESWLAPLAELPDLRSLTIDGFKFEPRVIINDLQLPLKQ